MESKIMFKLLNKTIFCKCIRDNARYYCASRFDYKSIYTAEEADKILSEINALHINDLSKYNITKGRLNKFEMYKVKIGKFKSVEQLLEIDGFGVKILENFCNSILRNEAKKVSGAKPKVGTLLTPNLSEKFRCKINSCISIHINVSHITWSRLEIHQEPNGSYSSNLTHWDHYEIEDKKYQLSDLVKIILYLNKIIPQADVYIFENEQISQSSVGGSTPGSIVQINVNIQKIQLMSMLSLILSNRNLDENVNTYYLKRFIASRLFGLFVGNEKVSTESVVQKLLNLNDTDEAIKASDDNNNNKANSSIEVKLNTCFELEEKYSNFTNVQKELHGQSLLLGIAFLKLCLEKCSKSLNKLMIRTN